MTSILNTRKSHADVFNEYIQKRINAVVRTTKFRFQKIIQTLKSEIDEKNRLIDDLKYFIEEKKPVNTPEKEIPTKLIKESDAPLGEKSLENNIEAFISTIGNHDNIEENVNHDDFNYNNNDLADNDHDDNDVNHDLNNNNHDNSDDNDNQIDHEDNDNYDEHNDFNDNNDLEDNNNHDNLDDNDDHNDFEDNHNGNNNDNNDQYDELDDNDIHDMDDNDIHDIDDNVINDDDHDITSNQEKIETKVLNDIQTTSNQKKTTCEKRVAFGDITNISDGWPNSNISCEEGFAVYKKLGTKIYKIAGFHDPSATGLRRLGKTLSTQTIACILLSIQNRIDNKNELPSENWIKNSISKKVKNIQAKSISYNYFLHFAITYFSVYVYNIKKPMKDRSLEHKFFGLYEDIESIIDFNLLNKPKKQRTMRSFRSKKK
jgi:hypothetical protein